MPVIIKGVVHGATETALKMGYAPKVFARRFFGQMLTERNNFVGGFYRGRKVDGVFRKKLLRKTNSKGGKWPLNVVRIFRGEVFNTKQVEGMRLEMGPGLAKRAEFVKIIDFLGTGGTVTNSQFMPIPIYKNLPSIKKPYAQFKAMMSNDELQYVRDGGRVYWFSKTKNSPNPEDDLMFVGVKKINIKKQFDFEGDWNKRLPRVMVNMQKATDRAVEDINRGKTK